ncbi:MAG TPA: anti-sigma factor [Mesorhizobium sp.]|jgi:anti-sigma factor RsiW
MIQRGYSERDIHLALDGELPPDDLAGFERWLAANPDMQALAQRYTQDRQQLVGALEGILAEPVPERLSRLAGAKPRAGSDSRHLFRYAAAAALFVAGGLAGYLVAPQFSSATPPLVQMADNAIDAHLIYSNEKLHVVEVGADQRDHLQGWLSKRVGVKLIAPDLKNQGFELVGGRLLPAGKKTAAQFMYQDATGNRVSLYVTRDETGADTGYRVLEERGARALYWLDGGYACAVAGSTPEGTLSAIADATYKQLLEDQKG